MDSIVAIAQGIAGLDCEPEVKECLQALINLEMRSNAATPVSKLAYAREIEARFENWKPEQSETQL
jgi:hypothetical protein